MTVEFSEFEFSDRTRVLRRNGQRVKLTGQSLELLRILLEEPGRLVPREEIRRRLWPDTQVGFEHGLDVALSRLRGVLGDDGRRPIFIETIPRLGYRFILPVVPRSDADWNRGAGRMLATLGLYALVAIVTSAIALAIVHRHYDAIIQRATTHQR